MKNNLPSISSAYKSKLSGAIFSVIIFFIFYLFLIVVAIGLAILLGYFAIQLLSLKFNYYTGVIALALIGVGLSVCYYLIKFIFIPSHDDKKNMVEITKNGQPELFNLIQDIVEETGTQSPKRVYISPEVNASVSYNSIFWSMFLPIKKNLTIGLGLINSTTVGELKAILAHEFGHFSQRSMKVGGYVGQAHKIIFDTVYNNKNYEESLINGASFWAWQLMGAIAIGIIKVMQFFLKIFSEFLFKNHASLSREMEYHADAISTYITNPEEQISSLLRLSLSDSALNNTMQFYVDGEGKYKSKNIYENQTSLIKMYADDNNHSMINGLPKVDLDDISRYNKSKVVIEDSFASHPDTLDRVKKIQKNKTKNTPENNALASSLIQSYDVLCEAITKKVFTNSQIKNIGDFIHNETFLRLYKEKYPEVTFDKIYNGYYNQHNPIVENAEALVNQTTHETTESLFDDEKVTLVYQKNGAQNDLNLLNFLSEKPKGFKTFQYDGNLYKLKDAKSLIPKEEKNLETLSAKVKENDENIFKYFYQQADESKRQNLISLYKNFYKADKEFDEYHKALNNLSENMQFMAVTMPTEQIPQHRAKLLENEKSFKESLSRFVKESSFAPHISEENQKLFLDYLDANYVYFEHQQYKNNEVEKLFGVWNQFNINLSESYLKLKQDLLKTQCEFIEQPTI